MATMARIDNGTVAEILTADPFPPFHPDLVWVDCSAVAGVAEGWTYTGGVFAAPVVPSPGEADYKTAAQNLLDTTAKAKGYDGILSLCTYATSTNTTFAAQGQAGIAWRDAVWAEGYSVLAQVQAGTMAPPSISAFLALLPAMAWPEVPAP